MNATPIKYAIINNTISTVLKELDNKEKLVNIATINKRRIHVTEIILYISLHLLNSQFIL